MKVRMKVDVSVPGQGIGQAGQVLDLPEDQAKDYLRLGHAEKAEDGAKVDEIKEELAAKKRDKKPAPGPSETKAPDGVMTTATLGAPVPPTAVTPLGGTPAPTSPAQ